MPTPTAFPRRLIEPSAPGQRSASSPRLTSWLVRPPILCRRPVHAPASLQAISESRSADAVLKRHHQRDTPVRCPKVSDLAQHAAILRTACRAANSRHGRGVPILKQQMLPLGPFPGRAPTPAASTCEGGNVNYRISCESWVTALYPVELTRSLLHPGAGLEPGTSVTPSPIAGSVRRGCTGRYQPEREQKPMKKALAFPLGLCKSHEATVIDMH